MLAVLTAAPWLAAGVGACDVSKATSTSSNIRVKLCIDAYAALTQNWCDADCKQLSGAGQVSLQGAANNAIACGRFDAGSLCFPNCNKCLIEHWDVSSQTSLDGVFQNAVAPDNDTDVWPDLSKWDVSKVTSMQATFQDSNVDAGSQVGSWTTAQVTNFNSCFNTALAGSPHPDATTQVPSGSTFPDVSGWVVSGATSMDDMFYDADITEAVDLSGWDVSKVTSARGMFAFTRRMHNLNIGGWTVTNLEDAHGMFMWSTLDTDIGTWVTPKLKDMSQMFMGAGLFNHDLNSWDTSEVTDLSSTFNRAWKFAGDVDGWNTAKVTSLSNTFSGEESTGLTTVFAGPISGWTVNAVTDFTKTFMLNIGMAANTALGQWTTSAGETFDYMFANASNFHNSALHWDTSAATSMIGTFKGATLFDGDISKWDTSKVVSTACMFCGAAAFNNDVSKWATGNVQSFKQMFQDADSFNVDISGWSTGSGTDFSNMFLLTTAASKFTHDLGQWDVRSGATFANMFGGQTTFAGPLDCWGAQLSPATAAAALAAGMLTGTALAASGGVCWAASVSTACTLTGCVTTSTTVTTSVPPCGAGKYRDAGTGNCVACAATDYKHSSMVQDACVQKTDCPPGTLPIAMDDHKALFNRVCGYITDECPEDQYRVDFDAATPESGVWIIKCEEYALAAACPPGETFRVVVDAGNAQFPTFADGSTIADHPWFQDETTQIIKLTHLCEPRTQCTQARNEYVVSDGSTTADRVCKRCPALAPGDSLWTINAGLTPDTVPPCMVSLGGAYDNSDGDKFECTGVHQDNAQYCCRNQYADTQYYDPSEITTDSAYADGTDGGGETLSWDVLSGQDASTPPAKLASAKWCPNGLSTPLVSDTTLPSTTGTTSSSSSSSTAAPTTDAPDDDAPVKISAVGDPSREEKAVGYATLGAAGVLIAVGVWYAAHASGAAAKIRGYAKLQ